MDIVHWTKKGAINFFLVLCWDTLMQIQTTQSGEITNNFNDLDSNLETNPPIRLHFTPLSSTQLFSTLLLPWKDHKNYDWEPPGWI